MTGRASHAILLDRVTFPRSRRRGPINFTRIRIAAPALECEALADGRAEAVVVRRAMRQSVFYLHHIWIATAVAGFIGLIDVIQYADAKRTSISTNLRILASLDASRTWFAFSILFTFISAAIMRRRLKRGTIRRMGVRWQRVVAGLAIPFLVLSYLLRDIDRLSQAPRHHPSSKVEVRALRASKLAFIPAIALVVFAQVASPLDNAFLGLTYVTEGPAAIDDPARYVLKWLRPELFIDSLDKYSKYIWIGAVSYFLGAIACSAVIWAALQRASRISKAALR